MCRRSDSCVSCVNGWASCFQPSCFLLSSGFFALALFACLFSLTLSLTFLLCFHTQFAPSLHVIYHSLQRPSFFIVFKRLNISSSHPVLNLGGSISQARGLWMIYAGTHFAWCIIQGDTDAQIMPHFCTTAESLGICLKPIRHNSYKGHPTFHFQHFLGLWRQPSLNDR